MSDGKHWKIKTLKLKIDDLIRPAMAGHLLLNEKGNGRLRRLIYMLFRKRNRKADEHPLKDKAARGIAKFLLRMQTKFSEFMNANTKNIPVKSLKIFLIAFCLFGGGFSIYLIAEAIFKEDKQQPLIKIDKVNVPKYYDQRGSDELQTEQYVDEETFRGIQSFERYMDNLKQTESGRKLHDSILIIRPGLMDSIRMLKEIYNSQIK